jgi:hypothetical protein
VNARIDWRVFDVLDRFGAPTKEQCRAFTRDNRGAIRAIAEAKVIQGRVEQEGAALSVRVSAADFGEYEKYPGNRLSYAAFDPSLLPGWGPAGRFGPAR